LLSETSTGKLWFGPEPVPVDVIASTVILLPIAQPVMTSDLDCVCHLFTLVRIKSRYLHLFGLATDSVKMMRSSFTFSGFQTADKPTQCPSISIAFNFRPISFLRPLAVPDTTIGNHRVGRNVLGDSATRTGIARHFLIVARATASSAFLIEEELRCPLGPAIVHVRVYRNMTSPDS